MIKSLSRRWALVQGFVAFCKLIKDPENQLDSVFAISARLAEPKALAQIGDHVAESAPYAKEAFERMHRIDLKKLLQYSHLLPENSLGQEFAKFVRSRNIDPADIPSLPVKSREDYVQAHLYETHDLWHVLCGFDTDTDGELGLQAFYLAQMPARLSLILMAAGFIHSALFDVNEKERRMSEIFRGWQMGKKAKALFGVDWSRYWSMPLTEVREHFALI
jgi:ubiquinone biosynthesis protein Coq4